MRASSLVHGFDTTNDLLESFHHVTFSAGHLSVVEPFRTKPAAALYKPK